MTMFEVCMIEGENELHKPRYFYYRVPEHELSIFIRRSQEQGHKFFSVNRLLPFHVLNQMRKTVVFDSWEEREKEVAKELGVTK